jgi:copper oxidase (laccase) domain-containing protein
LQYQQCFSNDFIASVFQSEEKKYFLDLWKANYLLLQEAGYVILRVQIYVHLSLMRLYSHRKENGKTGRFGALITLDS